MLAILFSTEDTWETTQQPEEAIFEEDVRMPLGKCFPNDKDSTRIQIYTSLCFGLPITYSDNNFIFDPSQFYDNWKVVFKGFQPSLFFRILYSVAQTYSDYFPGYINQCLFCTSITLR